MTKIMVKDNHKTSPQAVPLVNIPIGTAFLAKMSNSDSEDLRIKVSKDSYINLSGNRAGLWQPTIGALFYDYEEVDLEINVIHKG